MRDPNAATFSLVISHTPWRPERVAAKHRMLQELLPLSKGVPFLLNATDYRGTDWQVSKVAWALTQWRFSARHCNTTHHVFMTDDLQLAPGFWSILEAMVAEHPDTAIGLLSNHPEGPELWRSGVHGYRSSNWLVGPAYCLPHAILVEFLDYFEALSLEAQRYANDDSSINEFLSRTGRTTWHPLPTPIEHDFLIESTVGHGDIYSRERLSWRAARFAVAEHSGAITWTNHWLDLAEAEAMARRDYWKGESPMLQLPGAGT